MNFKTLFSSLLTDFAKPIFIKSWIYSWKGLKMELRRDITQGGGGENLISKVCFIE